MAVPAGAQVSTNPSPEVPDFRVLVQGTFDAETLAEFNLRVQDYAGLRARLEKGLPPLVVTTDADEIESFERRLARRLRDARGSWRGQLFIPSMEGQLKRMLDVHADAGTIAAIMDDSPSEFDVDVNDTYSKKRALATMPSKLLLLLPDLPPDLEYRFVGRHFIIRDVRANMIIDEIPFALRCRDCLSLIAAEEEEEDEKETGREEPTQR
jgi:hypothetical protein